jgi:hypothetical protein
MSEPAEDILGDFRQAALSVTRLYKSAAAASLKARSEGYQECLDDLLAFLDKEQIGLGGGEGWKIRQWATERLDGRDSVAQTVESEDEVDKPSPASLPELHQKDGNQQLSAMQADVPVRTDSAPPPTLPPQQDEELPDPVVPTQETFNFRSNIQMPYDSNLPLLANLDLTDRRPNDSSPRANNQITIQPSRRRHSVRPGSRSSAQLGRGAGAKRKLLMNMPNIPDLFDLASLGHDKDIFSSRNKRSRLG